MFFFSNLKKYFTKPSTSVTHPPPSEVDVLIVGGGLAGLQAAVSAHQAGLTYLVLEATNRTGGKVLSVPSVPGSPHTIDLGPAWINDTSQSYMWALGQKYKIKFHKQIVGDTLWKLNDEPTVRCTKDELPFQPEDQMAIMELIGIIYQISEKASEESFVGPVSQDLDKVTFKKWIETVAGNPATAVEVLNFLTHSLIGTGTEEPSALFMLKYFHAATGFQNIIGSEENGGQYLRPYTGSIGYVNGLVSELNAHSILNSTPVTSIVQSVDHCVVGTQTGKHYKAKKLIISIPTPLYRHISFEPKLPPGKQKLSSESKMSYLAKLVLVYVSPWWREGGLCGQLCSNKDPITLSIDTSVDEQEQYSLTLFICGDACKRWSGPPKPERQRTAIKQLEQQFETYIKHIPSPLQVHEMIWNEQPWFEGAPSAWYPPGVLTSSKNPSKNDLIESFNHIHFAGTETSDVWEGYMEGAVRSGERAANEVIRALGR